MTDEAKPDEEDLDSEERHLLEDVAPADGSSDIEPSSSSMFEEPDDADDSDEDFSGDSEEGDSRRPRKVFRQGERQSTRVATLKTKQEQEDDHKRATRKAAAAAPGGKLPKPPAQPKKTQRQLNKDSDASEGSYDSDDEGSTSEDEAVEVLERHVSEEQAKLDTATVRGMIELPQIVEFLWLFRHVLKLEEQLESLSVASLIDALVLSPGDGLLADLHTHLLQGIVNTKKLDTTNWAHYYAQRLAYTWQPLSKARFGQAPFRPDKGTEMRTYAALPAPERVMLLKLLCDLRAEREDVRSAADAACAPAPKKAKKEADGAQDKGAARVGRASRGRPAEPEPLTAEMMRRTALGADAAGNVYWWFDWCEEGLEGGADLGFMLAREGPPTVPKVAPASPVTGTAGSKVDTGTQVEGKEEAAGRPAAAGEGSKASEHEQEAQPAPALKAEAKGDESVEQEEEEVEDCDGEAEVKAENVRKGKTAGKEGVAGKSDGKSGASKAQETAAAAAAAGAEAADGKRRSGRSATVVASQTSEAAAKKPKTPKGVKKGKGEAGEGAAGKENKGPEGDKEAKDGKGSTEKAAKERKGKGKDKKQDDGKGGGQGKEGKKGKKEKRPNVWETYKLPAEAVPGKWDVVAVTVDELAAFGAKLGRSLKAADKAIAGKVINWIVPLLRSREDQVEKWKRARERMAKELSWGGMALGSRRARKEVDYTGERFDKAIKAGIRAGEVQDSKREQRGGNTGRSSREGSAQPPSRMARGSRHGSGADLVALDMGARKSRPGRTTAAAAVSKMRKRARDSISDGDEQGGEEEEAGTSGSSGDEGVDEGRQGSKHARAQSKHDADGKSADGAKSGQDTGDVQHTDAAGPTEPPAGHGGESVQAVGQDGADVDMPDAPAAVVTDDAVGRAGVQLVGMAS